jgi:hypothetical protein
MTTRNLFPLLTIVLLAANLNTELAEDIDRDIHDIDKIDRHIDDDPVDYFEPSKDDSSRPDDLKRVDFCIRFEVESNIIYQKCFVSHVGSSHMREKHRVRRNADPERLTGPNSLKSAVTDGAISMLQQLAEDTTNGHLTDLLDRQVVLCYTITVDDTLWWENCDDDHLRIPSQAIRNLRKTHETLSRLDAVVVALMDMLKVDRSDEDIRRLSVDQLIAEARRLVNSQELVTDSSTRSTATPTIVVGLVGLAIICVLSVALVVTSIKLRRKATDYTRLTGNSDYGTVETGADAMRLLSDDKYTYHKITDDKQINDRIANDK